ESMVPASEVYSIDEAFADLTGIPGDLTAFGRRIRSKILKCTGIPVGVGIGPTKTLAKLANHTAKRLLAQTGGVVDICDLHKRNWVLRNTCVSEVWGGGKEDESASGGHEHPQRNGLGQGRRADPPHQIQRRH
ncbi:hypothetical protein F2S71_01380, partial [Pseudomonas syringae pv. actinidiae]|nr:hypothetical protein [Pseudomonas syringae pv. actinidiae]